MTNGFTDTDAGYTPIPKNLSECMKDDPSSVNTVGWILRIEKWGRIILIINSIIGVVEAIGLGFFFGQIDSSMKTGFSIIPCLVIVGTTIIIDFIIYVVFHVIRLQLVTQAELVNNTKMLAKLTAYLAEKREQ